MSYCHFLAGLFEEGRVTLPSFDPISEIELTAGDVLISEFENLHRSEQPQNCPAFNPMAARWAGKSLYHACQFAVFREIDTDVIHHTFKDRLGEPLGFDAHYSVDLLFHFLPDVRQFANSSSSEDPLLEYIDDWARAWPLSSVGIECNKEVDVQWIVGHPSLLQIYVDRIISASDATRLCHPIVRQAVRNTLGAFPDLAPKIAAALTTYDATRATNYDET